RRILRSVSHRRHVFAAAFCIYSRRPDELGDENVVCPPVTARPRQSRRGHVYLRVRIRKEFARCLPSAADPAVRKESQSLHALIRACSLPGWETLSSPCCSSVSAVYLPGRAALTFG